MNLGTWRFLATTRVLQRGAERVALTPREAELLEYLSHRPGRIVSVAELLREVWNRPPHRSRAVTHCVSRLRRKLGADGARIVSVYGRGYVLDVVDASPLEGRRGVIEQVHLALELSRWAGLHGLVGIGKTAVARVVQASYAQAWWVDASRIQTSDQLCAALARSAGLLPVRGAPIRLLRTLDGERALLVLDGVDKLSSEGVALARSWLDWAPSLNMLTTARRRGRFEPQIRVPPLEDADAARLLARLAGYEPGHTKTPVPTELLGGVPLALQMAARRLRWMPPEELHTHLRHGVEILGTGPTSLHAGLLAGWHALRSSERELIRVAASLDGAFTRSALQAGLGQPMAAVVCALDGLLAAGWIESVRPRFRILEPVRRFVRAR